jgi:signal transduction histidine kinase
MVEGTGRVYRFEWAIFAATAASLSLLIVFPRVLGSRTEGVLHPHGFCYIWDPVLVWSHSIGDFLIGLAYVAIAAALAFFVFTLRQLLPFHRMFLAFGLFILTCGATHFMDVWTLWFADFWASAALKIVTAVASIATAVTLPPLIPHATRLLEAASLSEERRQQLAEARQQKIAMEAESRAKDMFLATLSHELRTPLNAVLGWVQVLQTTTSADSTTRKAIEAIHRNAGLQVRLVEDMLDLSSIVTGRLQLQRGPVDLVEVVRHAVEESKLTAESRSVPLSCKVPDEALLVEGDAARLEQVVANLLSNALKFVDPGGRVEVRLWRDDAWARLTVQDTGIGIDSAHLSRIFDSFFQVDQSATRSRSGLGLGLSIVRHLVEGHGGVVEARSEGRGRGATFEVRLPLA